MIRDRDALEAAELVTPENRVQQIESLCGRLFNRMGRDTLEKPWTGNSEAEDIAKRLHRLLGEQLQVAGKRSNQEDVAEFHRRMGQAIEPKPTYNPGDRVVRLRGSLVTEEFFEFIESMYIGKQGFRALLWRFLLTFALALLTAIVRWAPIRVNLPLLADAVADLKYVLEGTNLAFGVDGDRVWRLVHVANISKFEGPKTPEGKQLKPPWWEPPAIIVQLKEQGWDEPHAPGWKETP